MNADADIQVWLETMARTQPVVIIPYVQSTENKTLGYRLRAVKDGPGGRSVLGQGGTLQVPADTPTALGRMSLNYSARDACSIDLTLNENGEAQRNYHFACPE
ncbi:curli-like amyloid fiber formation chaperone CsgH [Pollutimonas sp. H1-120]|uniref:curli-like amyloid fiber formation chaperone CsgH n=1 Tax=Pollutimonas sp. H1-120 TaxID=3148824 RepID=UPI003B522C60